MITRERVRRVQEAAENLPPTPRSPEDEKIIDQYVSALVDNAFHEWIDPPAALKKKVKEILRKHPEPPIGEAVRLMLEEGRLGNDDRPMISDERYLPVHVHPPDKHNDGLRTVVRKEEQATQPEETRMTNYRCVADECRHGGLIWKRGQVFDGLARARGIPEPDGPCWESYNPDYQEVPGPMPERKIKARLLP